MTYSFTNNNLLNTKENYMYSKFYGKSLLFSYFKNRSENIYNYSYNKSINENDYYYLLIDFIKKNKKFKFIKTELKKFINEDKENLLLLKKKYLSYKYKPLPNLNRQKKFKTSELLDTIIINIINGKYKTETKKYIELLIKKFEVSKRLYTFYSRDFKKIGNQNKKIDNYLKLSTILAIEYFKKPNNRYLSTLLKINDLIISCNSNKTIKLNECKLVFILEKLYVKKIIEKDIL